jgi:hypothetical protein
MKMYWRIDRRDIRDRVLFRLEYKNISAKDNFYRVSFIAMESELLRELLYEA